MHMIRAVPQTESSSGYVRDPELQSRFDAAAATLLEKDGWENPQNGNRKELRADLALEGGGVKGIGLVGAVLVLSEAGYTFRGVAGTSAGAIAASLIAGISQQPEPDMTKLLEYMGNLEFSNFMPEGKVHHFLGKHGGKAGELLADAAILTHEPGIYPGTYLRTWLQPILHDELKIKTFADLKLTAEQDPGQSLVAGRDYRLVVHTSDITRGQLVQLPWDYPLYVETDADHNGIDDKDPVDSVRASMSIPFFFEPVTFEATPAKYTVPNPKGGSTMLTFGGGSVTWVDGGMLQNFPIHAFDRADGAPPRWPTIGIKLSRLQTEFPSTEASTSAISIADRCLHTMMNEWDSYAVDEQTAARTIFVDNAGLTATDFDLTTEQQNTLFTNGVQAATEFVIAMAEVEGIPRTSDQAKALMVTRRQNAGQGTASQST
jgi:NTE family protein